MSKYTTINVDTGRVAIMEEDEYLTPHFQIKEFRCKDGDRVILFSQRLVNWLEDIRVMVDVPIIINSAFRTWVHNKAVGGALNSLHMYGKAIDIRLAYGYSMSSFVKVIEHVCGRLCGIISYDKRNFVHIDLRPYYYRAEGDQ